WLMLANFFWVLAFDTEYAMVDRDDDIRIGIRTSALFFGRFDVLAVAGCYAAFIAMMVLIGSAAGLGPIYYLGLTLAATLALHHLWLIRDRDRMRCFAAFRGNNLFGMAVFVGVALDYAVRTGAWPRWYA
ncbi:MAG TPA: UbiA family prenyltransferase, partial [Casimicrobium huifangae]|nr:UbiA family prenyltransferase [Casimicrobium huifangae]